MTKLRMRAEHFSRGNFTEIRTINGMQNGQFQGDFYCHAPQKWEVSWYCTNAQETRSQPRRFSSFLQHPLTNLN